MRRPAAAVETLEGRSLSRARLLRRGALLVGVAVAEFGPSNLLSVARAADGGRVALEEFGAVGDGRADDTEALRRAIAAVGSGGTITSAAGRTFLISSSIVLANRCALDLAGSTLKKAASMHGAALVLTGPATVRHLTVDGSRAEGATGPGIDLRGVPAEFSDVRVRRCQEAGVVLTTSPNAALTASRCAATDNGGSGFSILTGVAKLFDCSADRNEDCGFFFGVSSRRGSRLDGVARRNRIGVQIRSRGGTSHLLRANDNVRFGLLMDYDGPGERPGEWTFDYVECSRNGVGREASGTGLELIGADKNRFTRVLSRANPGYGIAIAGGSSYNWFGRVRCDQRGAHDGDPGIHISGGASYNEIYRAVIRNHTFGVVVGEGLSPKNNDFNYIRHLRVVGCRWGVLRLDSGSSNRFGHVVSRRNTTIDPHLTGGLIDFRSEDTFRNTVDFLDHRNRHSAVRAPKFLVHADGKSWDNVVRRGSPLALLRRRTRDANGKNHFFRG
jgi:hypothetical protein